MTDDEWDDSQDTSGWFSRRNTICGARTPLQTLSKGNGPLCLSPFVRGTPLRHSMTSGIGPHSEALRQKAARQPGAYPWEQCKGGSLERSLSTRSRGSASVTTVQSGKKSGATTAKKNCQIAKETLEVKIHKEDAAADWGFTVGGGLLSPYGDLAISVVEVSPGGPVAGILKPGDEIVEFNGGSLGALTLSEAERSLGNEANDASVTIKRKYLQRSGSVREQSNPWSKSGQVHHGK